MTKRIQAKSKICRRLGVNLWGRAKNPLARRDYGPGEHGQKRRKLSDYANQLAAKQKLKRYYANMSERQFRRAYEEAARQRGDTAENLIALLERRLDTVVYRGQLRAHPLRCPAADQSRPCAGQRQAREHPELPGARGRHDRDRRALAQPPDGAGDDRPSGARRAGVHRRRAQDLPRSSSPARPRCRTCPTRCRWTRSWSSSTTRAEQRLSFPWQTAPVSLRRRLHVGSRVGRRSR